MATKKSDMSDLAKKLDEIENSEGSQSMEDSSDEEGKNVKSGIRDNLLNRNVSSLSKDERMFRMIFNKIVRVNPEDLMFVEDQELNNLYDNLGEGDSAIIYDLKIAKRKLMSKSQTQQTESNTKSESGNENQQASPTQSKVLLNLDNLNNVNVTQKSTNFTNLMNGVSYKNRNFGGQVKIIGVEDKAFAMAANTVLISKLNGQGLMAMISLGKTFSMDDTADTFIQKKQKKVSAKGFGLTNDMITQIKSDYAALKPFLEEFKTAKELLVVNAIKRFKELNTGKYSDKDTFQVNFSWIDVYSSSSIAAKLKIIYDEIKISPIVGEVANMGKSQVVWMGLKMQESIDLFTRLCFSTLKILRMSSLAGQTDYKYVDNVAKVPKESELASSSRSIPIFFLTSGKEYKLTLAGKIGKTDDVKLIGDFINQIIASQVITTIGKKSVNKIQKMESLAEEEIERVDKWWSEIKAAIKTVPVVRLTSKVKKGADIKL